MKISPFFKNLYDNFLSHYCRIWSFKDEGPKVVHISMNIAPLSFPSL